MAETINRGFFITFEGPEGTGKSTHSARICKDLTNDGHSVLYTAEPGGSLLGEAIRKILLDKHSIALSNLAELLLFEADRAQHMEEIIVPALSDGKIVVCDRFNTATFAYQGYGLGMDMELIKKIDISATKGIDPDITILMDVDVETGLARAGKLRTFDRMEKRGLEFHRRVRAGYLDIADKDPERVKVIKVIGDLEETYKIVRKAVYDFIEGHKRAA